MMLKFKKNHSITSKLPICSIEETFANQDGYCVFKNQGYEILKQQEQ